MSALTQQPPSSHHQSRQLFFQLYSDVILQFCSNSNLDNDLVVGFCTDAARIVGSIQEGLQQEESVLLQFRRVRECTSTGLAHFNMKFHKDSYPVLIFGVLVQDAKSRKVVLAEEVQEILNYTMFSSACTLSRCLIETPRLRRHHSRGRIMACINILRVIP